MDKCFDCQSEEREYKLKLISTNRNDFTFPKYLPQIKEQCAKCGRYIKFAKQTPDLIEMVNKWLEKFVIKHQAQGKQDFSEWLNK